MASQAFAPCQAACTVVDQHCWIDSNTKVVTLMKMYCKDPDAYALSRMTQHACNNMLCYVLALGCCLKRLPLSSPEGRDFSFFRSVC